MTARRNGVSRWQAFDATVEQTIDLLYHSTRDPTRLTPALHALRRLLDATRVAYVMPLARVCAEADDFSPEADALDDTAADAWCTPGDALLASRVGVWLQGHAEPGTATRPASRRVCTKLHDGDPGAVYLFLERASPAAPFGDQTLALLKRLLPDLSRVSRLHGDMAPSLPAMAATMAVDTLRIAQCVVDADLAVLQCNAPMKTLLDGPAPIGRQGALLQMGTARDEALLQQAVADAAAATPHSTLFHTAGADGRRLSVHAVPMRARAPAFGTDPADDRLVLLIIAHVGATEVTSDALHSLYDMSPAEARAALQVLSGGSGGEMASRLGISLSTFKTQLQAAYAKTGTRRKTELMRLLLAPGLRAN